MPARFKEKYGVRIYPDGREVCYTQKAWDRRREECFERDGFLCQCIGDCFSHSYRGKCNAMLSLHSENNGAVVGDAHHKKTRGHGGGRRDDRLSNLESFCRNCHAHETERERFKGLKKISQS